MISPGASVPVADNGDPFRCWFDPVHNEVKGPGDSAGSEVVGLAAPGAEADRGHGTPTLHPTRQETRPRAMPGCAKHT
jgi:hypothetical protein